MIPALIVAFLLGVAVGRPYDPSDWPVPPCREDAPCDDARPSRTIARAEAIPAIVSSDLRGG
ncbi:MAG: hypothetical protein ACXVEE_30180 [Polyangiales bacterium]